MTNKVKPFYIRITDDMTPQMVQDAFDKCVDAGADAGDGMSDPESKYAYPFKYNFGRYELFGVDRELTTRIYSTDRFYGESAQEITLDQLDEWLGLEAEGEWKNGDDCVFDNRVKRDFDNPLLVDEYLNQHAIVHRTFKNKRKFDMVLIEFEDGYCAAVMQECISKPETPEQKSERERLEAVEEITEFLNSLSPHCKEKMEYVARAIVDKTNYRKQ